MKITNSKKAFTLVELLVSVGIFAFMTSLMVAKYGNFNQSVLLTNLAYDVAVTIRTAQSYGLSVKSAVPSGGSAQFQNAYGVQFDSTSGSDARFYLFADTYPSGNPGGDGYYTHLSDVLISEYSLKRGAIIDSVCVNNAGSCVEHVGELTILFKRPDPNALIYLDGDNTTSYSYAEIIIKGTDGSTRTVNVRENGQISVGN